MVILKEIRHGVASRIIPVRRCEWKFVATSCEVMMRSEMLLMCLMYRGAEAMRERYVKDVMAAVVAWQRGNRILQRLTQADVNVVEVAIRVRWLSMGRCGESHETRHLI